VLGAAGLLAALFMPWYRLAIPDELLSEVNAAAQELGEFGPLLSQGLAGLDPIRATAWQAFGYADVVLAGLAVAVLGAAAVRLAGGPSGVWIARLGAVAAGLVLFKLASPPGASPELSEQLLEPEPGLFLALASALAIAAGGALAARSGG
jgi:hypothetical protein